VVFYILEESFAYVFRVEYSDKLEREDGRIKQSSQEDWLVRATEGLGAQRIKLVYEYH
jgi:hypothetical protein